MTQQTVFGKTSTGRGSLQLDH